MRTLAEMNALLDAAKAVLEQPLAQVVDLYGQDAYLQSQLKPFMADWGHRPVHEFLSFITSDTRSEDEGPDCFSSTSKIGNLFWILEAMRFTSQR